MGMIKSAVAASVILTCAPQAALSQCKNLQAPSATQLAAEFDIPMQHVNNVLKAYRGISDAAGIEATLYICSGDGWASAKWDARNGHSVKVYRDLIRLLDGNIHELAGVLGHEFGHLFHRHGPKIGDVNRRAGEELSREMDRRAGRGERSAEIIPKLIHKAMHSFKETRAFSREAEREADDQGFTFAHKAGFDPSGFRRAGEKLRAVSGGAQEGWFATHPGWDERVGYSARLETNEEFRKQAEGHLSTRRFDRLQATLHKWTQLFPDSGAAAFYRAMYLQHSGQPQGRVSAAFEEAVSLFDGEGLSKAGQAYQREAHYAPVSLCVSLFKEGRRVETLYCLKRLESEEEVEAFRKVTGWRNFILVDRRQYVPQTPLYAARSEGGNVAITNCSHIAKTQGLKEVISWKGMRPGQALSPEFSALQCSPDFCDCEPIDFKMMFPSLKLPPEIR